MTEKKIHTWIKFILLTLPFVFLLFQYCLQYNPLIENFKIINNENKTIGYYQIPIVDDICYLFNINEYWNNNNTLQINFEPINKILNILTIKPLNELFNLIDNNLFNSKIGLSDEFISSPTLTPFYYFGYATTIELLDCMTYIFTFFIRFIKKMFSKLEV